MSRSASPAAERAYHHGDLRRAILDAAIDILNESQSLDFSIRELARRAGVSHNAPYKHFAEKRDLLAAISATGFDMLTRRMEREIVGKSNPRARLEAMAQAYIRHGAENPALYRLMFGGYLSEAEEGRPAIERAAAEETKTLLSNAIVDGALGTPMPRNAKNERKIDGAILAMWSVLHGLAMLLADGLVGPSEKCDEICESLVKGVLDGLTNRSPTLPVGTWLGPPSTDK